MTIAASPPRGGIAEDLAGRTRALLLRNAEIERLEDAHGSAFALLDGFSGRAPRPRVAAVRDMVALGLVGAGMADTAADALISGLGPGENDRLYLLAQILLLAAFSPDPELPAAPAPAPGDAKKKSLGA